MKNDWLLVLRSFPLHHDCPVLYPGCRPVCLDLPESDEMMLNIPEIAFYSGCLVGAFSCALAGVVTYIIMKERR